MNPIHVFLESKRLVLRRFEESDLENLLALDSDPAVMRFVGGRITPRGVIETTLLPGYLAYYTRGERYGFWAAIEKSTGEFLGWFHLRPAEGAGPDEPEFGYRLRASAWGRGYATEGSRALIRKGFMELSVDRVVASAFVDHLASRRVMEKSGMSWVRTYHVTSAELGEGDVVEYALSKADWELQQAAGPPG